MWLYQRCKIINKVPKQTAYGEREKCYSCYRPQSSCMCAYITPLETKTKFVILMHTHEFKKVKNATGHFTHLALTNSELFIDTSFQTHERVNRLLQEYNCYVLYPSDDSIVLNTTPIKKSKKENLIFIIDATWHNAKKLLRDSPNIQALPKISFTHTKASAFAIKEQPMELCLSTIESTHCILELLAAGGNETLTEDELESFLEPFRKMVAYQVKCSSLENKSPRFRA